MNSSARRVFTFAAEAEHCVALIAYRTRSVLAIKIFAPGRLHVATGEIFQLLGQHNGRKDVNIGSNDPATTRCANIWASVWHYAEIHDKEHSLVRCRREMAKSSILTLVSCRRD